MTRYATTHGVRAGLRVATIGVALSGARSARAHGADIALTWIAPQECPDAQHVLDEARRLLGPPSPRDKPVAARAVVRSTGKGWRVDVETESEQLQGHRSFRAASCEEIADATALVLALLVNPAVAEAPRSPGPPPPSPSAPPLTDTPPTKPPRPRPVAFSASVVGAADVGTLPRPGVGAGLSAGIALQRFRFVLTASGQPNHGVALADSGRVGAAFSKLTGGIRACAAVVPGQIDIDACVAEEVAYVRAASYGIANPKVATTTWSETLGGGSATWFFAPPWGLRIEGFFGVPVPRREFTVAPLGVVHTLPLVTGKFGAGIEVRF